MILEKYSMGIGDRFSRQGKAQLQALTNAKEQGVDIVPVWNKSHREHRTIKTSPADVRKEADEAVKALGWDGSYYVDADHVGLKNVDLFVDSSNFFTIDVANFIGKVNAPAHGNSGAVRRSYGRRGGSLGAESEIRSFVEKHRNYIGSLEIRGVEGSLDVTEELIEMIARRFLGAIKEAGRIYRHVETIKGRGNFVTEVSMDEADEPQTPVEMLFILAGIAEEGIPAQTIAPKFAGRFNKGVDYVGDLAGFAREFEKDLAVIAFAIDKFALPENLKLSVHSGSDKFSIYGAINKAITKHNAGLHVKTAGTTWLEELIGLALAEGEGLRIAKEVYMRALDRFDELCGPYAAVIDIDKARLPLPDTVETWSGKEYADTLRHDLSCEQYNPHFRQTLHVGYKIAAEMGNRYIDALDRYEDIIARNVTENIYDRHIKRIFIGSEDGSVPGSVI